MHKYVQKKGGKGNFPSPPLEHSPDCAMRKILKVVTQKNG